jgi:hypothetical protein
MPPFAPPKGIHDRTLPGHPKREADTLLFDDCGMIAQAAFVRLADVVVLGPIPGEHFDRPVVPFERIRNLVDP